MDLVLKELGVESIDLLIVSFPNIVFDADDESEDDVFSSDEEQSSPSSNPTGPTTSPQPTGCDETSGNPESISSMLQTWRTIESLHRTNLVHKLGLSEFGTVRLSKFLAEAKVRPAVDQINVRDCCVVPKPLIVFAKQEGIELLTHSDCTNVLPRGTLRELLGTGESGAGVLVGEVEGEKEGLRGDVEPQWVIKYTAVVKDRGIVENKGYFAVAELKES